MVETRNKMKGSDMKIRILKNVDVDEEFPRLEEIHPKYLPKNNIYRVDFIEILDNNLANIVLDDGNVLLEVPVDSFETSI
jgi:hypothetical protein